MYFILNVVLWWFRFHVKPLICISPQACQLSRSCLHAWLLADLDISFKNVYICFNNCHKHSVDSTDAVHCCLKWILQICMQFCTTVLVLLHMFKTFFLLNFSLSFNLFLPYKIKIFLISEVHLFNTFWNFYDGDKCINLIRWVKFVY